MTFRVNPLVGMDGKAVRRSVGKSLVTPDMQSLVHSWMVGLLRHQSPDWSKTENGHPVQ